MLVSPNLGNSEKDYIRGWDDKLDAVIALGLFMPDTLNQINEQITRATDNRLNIYDVDNLMHKLLGKQVKDTMADFEALFK